VNRHPFSLFINITILLSFALTTPFAQKASRPRRVRPAEPPTAAPATHLPAPPAQPQLNQVQLTPPALTGSVENVSGEYHLKLVNNDASRRFQGVALVSLGTASAQTAATQIPIDLAPRDAQTFLLYSLPVSGEQYSLTVKDGAGRIVLQRIAPVQQVSDISLAEKVPTANTKPSAPAPASIVGGIKVNARLTGGEKESDPFVLVFEITCLTPIPDATLQVTAKGFQQTAKISVLGQGKAEFKLPDELEAQKLFYILSDAHGRIVARGEADLNQMLSDERTAIGEFSSDRPSYKPGDTANLKIAVRGAAKAGYRMEILGKNSHGEVFFRDLRRGNAGEKSGATQQFTITIPAEATGPVRVEVKIFDGESGTLLDSNEREIALTNGTPSSPPPND
jgi:hypothetical protein